MPWSEKWRSADRPDSSEIPDEYGISARSSEKVMIAYFGGTTIFSYVTMRYIGTQDLLIAGLPVMMWLVVLISVLVILGLYVVVAQSDTTESVSGIQDKAEANND